MALLPSAQAIGGSAAPTSWLGHKIDPAQTPFCQEQGCTLIEVRSNDSNRMGWHDGTMRAYQLRDGSQLEVDVRPEGWISNARLQFKRSRMTAQDHRTAATFLTAVTGRTFRAGAIASCEQAGLALNNPDAYGPEQPLSHWKTPNGLPYKARCGVGSQVGVWAGWMQQ